MLATPLWADQGYAVFDSSTGTLTFKYGTPSGTAGTDYYNTDNTGTSGVGWYGNRESILTVIFDSSFKDARPTSCNRWFYQCFNLTSVKGIENLNTSLVTGMTAMFASCGLTELNLSSFDTSNVKSMSYMFQYCGNLEKLNLSSFDTSKVTDMSGMFFYCHKLNSLKFGEDFKTNRVENMSGMFAHCFGLKSLDVSGFDTSIVKDMSRMFDSCSGLTSLDVSGFNTPELTITTSMFYNCTNLTSLTFGENFTTSKVTSFGNMFYGCSQLRYLDFHASNDVIGTTKLFTEANINRNGNTSSVVFGRAGNGLPLTTVIYMPHGISKSDYANYTDLPNLVFNDGGTLKATLYYSADKTDIELPREFKATTAEYIRTMNEGTKYGTVILPYSFNSNDEVQAYTLNNEFESEMYFVEAATVPAHTPFFYRKKTADATTVNFNNTVADYGITVAATHTTSAAEGGEPYCAASGMNGWTTKGYYITEEIDATPASPATNTFYIARDKFWRATGTLKMNPHRVTYQGQWQYEPGSEAPAMLSILTMASPDVGELPTEVTKAIDAAHERALRQGADAIYDLHGRRQGELRKGINILRMADGSTTKIVKQ